MREAKIVHAWIQALQDQDSDVAENVDENDMILELRMKSLRSSVHDPKRQNI